jgi:glycolate oxidase FAD binding subunit
MAAPRPGTEADAVVGVAPRLVLVPETVEEAVAAVGALARDRMRVAFVGGGTDLELGAPPEGLEAVLRTERLTRVVEHAPSDQIVAVEAGLPLAELQRQLAAHGQRLAIDPPHPERATAGGIVAANAFGPLRARYGSARDLIIGVSLVRADGVLARGGGKVVKNVAGFDLPRLLVGSLGTLGLVATVTFRLHPLPEAAATLLFPGLDADQAWGLTREMRSRQLEPAAAAALSAGGHLDLGVRFEGFGPGVAQQGDRLLDLGRKAGLAAERLDEAGARAFWERHDRLRAAGPLRAKLAAPPASLPAVVRDATDPLLRALPGGGLAWYPTLGLGFATGSPASAGAVRAAVEQARAALHGLGGSLVLAAAPREVRAVLDVWGPPPPSIGLMRSLKARLDPERRLAPGRFVGGI